MQRRTFLKSGAALAAAIFIPEIMCSRKQSASSISSSMADIIPPVAQTRICDELFTYVEPDNPLSFCSACTVHVLKGPGKTVMIDTGEFSQEFKKSILPHLETDGLKSSEIQEIWHTHGHADHLGADSLIQGLSGCSIKAHPSALRTLEDIPKFMSDNIIDEAGEDCSLIMGTSPNVIRYTAKVLYKNQDVAVSKPFIDGEILDIGFPVEIKYTPGHSPDHISFYVPSKRILFTGDTFDLLCKARPVLNTPQSNAADLQATLEWMIRKQPAIMACGHDGTIVGENHCEEVLRCSLYYLTNMKDSTMKILSRGPASLDDFLHLYPFKNRKHWKFEARMAQWCMMKSLVQEGVVKRLPKYKGKTVVDLKWQLI
jgi:glyoxylase-like metal-dependent hydrolase (beta-lactamase superfamily II)